MKETMNRVKKKKRLFSHNLHWLILPTTWEQLYNAVISRGQNAGSSELCKKILSFWFLKSLNW